MAWFAWHRRDEYDAVRYDDATARRTVLEFVCAALVVPRGAGEAPVSQQTSERSTSHASNS